MNASPRLKVGVVSDEFFDLAFGRMGGFGWLAREVSLLFNANPEFGGEVLFLTGEKRGDKHDFETTAAGTRVLLNRWDGNRREYVRRLKAEQIDVLLTIDYRRSYRGPLRGLRRTSILMWVQDPRPPEDIDKINGLRIPGGGDVKPLGVRPVDCTSMSRVVRTSRWTLRRIVWAAPLTELGDKVEKTYGVRVRNLALLPYPLDLRVQEIRKSERPSVVFLGRLDPIKRPWVFSELARRFSEVEFLFLGQAHFTGEGTWKPQNLPPNVRLTGHVDGQEKQRLLSSAWVLVNTSIHEALPVSFIEALACETPILSCQNPGGLVSRYGIYAGRWDATGMEGLTSFEHGLKVLIGDDELRIQLGREGRAWVAANHTREAFLNAFSRLCRELRTRNGLCAPVRHP